MPTRRTPVRTTLPGAAVTSELVLEEVATAPFMAYAGTSFAAPSIATYVLLDLVRAEPRCGATGRDARLAHGNDLDWPRETAVALRCGP